MENFPIFQDTELTSREDLYAYVRTFPHHLIRISFQITHMTSTHRYNDGLAIKLFWNIRKPMHHIIVNRLEEIFLLLEWEKEGYIELMDAKILYFSNQNAAYTPLSYEKFYNMLTKIKNKKPLSSEEYYQYEYDKNIRYSISDQEFDKMIKYIDNLLKFEQYLQERENKNF